MFPFVHGPPVLIHAPTSHVLSRTTSGIQSSWSPGDQRPFPSFQLVFYCNAELLTATGVLYKRFRAFISSLFSIWLQWLLFVPSIVLRQKAFDQGSLTNEV